MLVRLTVEHRRGTATLFPGTLLELPGPEALILVQDGVAVPVDGEELQKETRKGEYGSPEVR